MFRRARSRWLASVGFGVGLAAAVAAVRITWADSPLPVAPGLIAPADSFGSAPLGGYGGARVWDSRVVPASATADLSPGPNQSSLVINNSLNAAAAPADEWPGPGTNRNSAPAMIPAAASHSRVPSSVTRSAQPMRVNVRQAQATMPIEASAPAPNGDSIAAPQSPAVMSAEMPGYEGHRGFMAFLAPAGATEEPSSGQPNVDPFELHKPARTGNAGELGEGELAGCAQSCCGGWCGGLEYLLVAPRLSNDRAFQTLTATTTATLSTQSLHDVNFQYDYDSDYHVTFGYKRDNEELRFGFWHFQARDNEVGTASGNFAGGAGTQIQGFGTTPLTVAGENLNAASHILMNMYDIDDLHKIDIPSNIDLNWFWGVRGVEFHRSYDALTPFETVSSDTTFAGVGPRVGVEGRRQIGCSHFSVYFAADVGVMLGHFKNDGSDLQPGVLQNSLDQYSTDDMRKIENLEMALAISWQPNCCTTVTAGWLFEDFSNLGNSGVPSSVCATCAGLVEASGAGQEVSFTGLFVRAEHCF